MKWKRTLFAAVCAVPLAFAGTGSSPVSAQAWGDPGWGTMGPWMGMPGMPGGTMVPGMGMMGTMGPGMMANMMSPSMWGNMMGPGWAPCPGYGMAPGML